MKGKHFIPKVLDNVYLGWSYQASIISEQVITAFLAEYFKVKVNLHSLLLHIDGCDVK